MLLHVAGPADPGVVTLPSLLCVCIDGCAWPTKDFFAKPAVQQASASPLVFAHWAQVALQAVKPMHVLGSIGACFSCRPAQATCPWPQRGPEGCVFIVRGSKRDTTAW